MENDPQSALGHINRGIDAHNANQDDRAQRHFALALLLEPDNEVAWLWMAESSSDRGQKLYCLNRAVGINPDSRGHVHRDLLRQHGVSPAVPPAISDLENPPLPPRYRPVASGRILPLSLPVPQARKLLRWPFKAEPATSKNVDQPAGPDRARTRWLIASAALVLLLAVASIWLLVRGAGDEGDLYVAVAGPMSGPDAWIGEELQDGAAIAVDQWNARGEGPTLHLVTFDDQNDPDIAADIARTIVEDDRIVAVVGHGTSGTSLAAAPIYTEANLPAVGPTATSNALTDFPGYFRTIFSDRSAAMTVATYLTEVMDVDRATIVAGDTRYEQDLASQFADQFIEHGGTVVMQLDLSSDALAGSVRSAVDQLREEDDPGMIFLATTEMHGHDFLLVLRRAGLHVPIFAAESMGSSEFAHRFAHEPEEVADPGFFTDDMYAASPLIYDSVGADAVRFSDHYAQTHDSTPSWRPARTWDAVSAIATAASRSGLDPDTTDVPAFRAAVLEELHLMNSADASIRGLSGAFYFTPTGDSPQALSVGQFSDRIFSSSPIQYRLVTNPSQYDMDEEIAAGRAMDLGGYFIRQYRVIYVGIEMIELRDLSTSDQTYRADFFVYFRWDGDETPLNIMFTNSTDAGLSLGNPISEQVTDAGQNYRLYRVQGVFNEPLDFHEYPWDRHSLTIRFLNPVMNQNDIVYVPDPTALGMSQFERTRSSIDQSRSFNRIPSWNIDEVIYSQVSITSTADDYDTEGLVQYSEFQLIIDTGRDVNNFLAKNLLPLALLTLVTYIAIWFPAEQAGARIGFAITALLSSSVMLNSISNQLPEIGYTVAIEWGYYAYLGMSAMLILLTIAVDRSYKAKRFARVRKLDAFIRTAYPLAIAGTVAIYWVTFYR